MRIINVAELNSAICRALHLDPANVQQIDIQICGGKAPSVTVTLLSLLSGPAIVKDFQ